MKYIRLFSVFSAMMISVAVIAQSSNDTGGCVHCSLPSDNNGRCVGKNGIATCSDEGSILNFRCKKGAKKLSDCTPSPQ